MLKIIKYDGSIEDFNPDKLNRWAAWAADRCPSISWSDVLLDTMRQLPEEITSRGLQETLIKVCLENNSWEHNMMAGRLYVGLFIRDIHQTKNTYPTVRSLHQELRELGYMIDLGYTDEEYEKIEKIIDHSKNLEKPYFALDYIIGKYGIKNRSSGRVYESPQFTYMRMAMHVAADEKDSKIKIQKVDKLYNYLSDGKINAPTPNYTNLGTPHKGFASCNVMTTLDTAASLAAHDHIAYTMTYMSAGIGSHINSRAINEPIRGGSVLHLGKLPLYRALAANVSAMTQNSRGGSATTYYMAFDPEVMTILKLKNPLSTEDRRIRGIDYAIQTNELFAEKAAKNENIFTFNSWSAPDLYDAFYGPDPLKFREIYAKYEADENFVKNYVSAREIALTAMEEGFTTGRKYLHFPEEANRHTPFLDTIYSSNLCNEIELPTKGYKTTADLYRMDHHDGEVALCSLAGICVDKIESDEEYEDAMYYALLMIDRTIHLSDYELPHVGYTAKRRLNAGVGIIGLAHYMAMNGFKYADQEGKNEIHKLSEKHMYYAIRGSLRLSKEYGIAPWMDKTKWPQGWMPIDTYNRNVDDVVTVENQMDWESLRKEVIENGGIRNSALIAHMPSESSSKAAGTTNGLYPVRDVVLIKKDKNIISDWCAPSSNTLNDNYEIAWQLSWKHIIDLYAIVQKFTDQGISADVWHDVSGATTVGSAEMLREYFYTRKMGLKGRYYLHSRTTHGVSLESGETIVNDEPAYEYSHAENDQSCAGGACTL